MTFGEADLREATTLVMSPTQSAVRSRRKIDSQTEDRINLRSVKVQHEEILKEMLSVFLLAEERERTSKEKKNWNSFGKHQKTIDDMTEVVFSKQQKIQKL